MEGLTISQSSSRLYGVDSCHLVISEQSCWHVCERASKGYVSDRREREEYAVRLFDELVVDQKSDSTGRLSRNIELYVKVRETWSIVESALFMSLRVEMA